MTSIIVWQPIIISPPKASSDPDTSSKVVYSSGCFDSGQWPRIIRMGKDKRMDDRSNKHFYAYEICLEPLCNFVCCPISINICWDQVHLVQKCNSDTLPPCEKYKCLDTQEFPNGTDGTQLVLCRIIEEYQAI